MINEGYNIQKFRCDIFTYLLVFMSGSILAISHYYKQLTILFLLLVIVISLFKRNPNNGNLHMMSAKKFFIVVLMLFTVTQCMLRTSNYVTYGGIIMQILTALILSNIIQLENFKKSFIRVMTFLAVVSIPFFFIGVVMPSFAFSLPNFKPVAQCSYYNMIIYEYKFSIINGALENRNSSIFWEPGAYAFFLNLALFFDLSDFRRLTFKDTKKLIVLIVAVITTLSTTGYICLAAILIFYFRRQRSNQFIGDIIIVAAIAVTAINLDAFQELFVNKTNMLINDPLKILQRIDLDHIGIAFKYTGLLPLIGITFENYETLIGGASNSLIYYSLSLGILFLIAISLCISSFIKTFDHRTRLLGLIIIICFSMSESVIIKPIMLYFYFSSLSLTMNNSDTFAESKEEVGVY